jgi:ABC-2 type transport system ATP-binding protein
LKDAMAETTERRPVLRVERLRKVFSGHLGIGKRVAVDGIDLEVRSGEVFGLLGPNGAGKTTTLKTILGLLRPTGGRVTLFGREPSDPEARAHIGFLPEHPYFYDYLTAEEILDLYGRLRGMSAATRRSRIPQILRKVGLTGSTDVALRKLSKGTIQRLGLAQAILHDPDLLILDEPMSGLDPIGRREVRDLILAEKAAGKTIFFSSHILTDAEMLCDRVGIVVAGKLSSVGGLDEMIGREVRWFEVSVAGGGPGLPGERLSVAGGETLLRVPDIEALTGLLSAVQRGGGQVTSIWPRRRTLEDIFLEEVEKVRGEGGATWKP